MVGKIQMSRDLISDLISEEDHFTDIFYFGFGQVREALIKSDKRWKYFLLNIDYDNYME